MKTVMTIAAVLLGTAAHATDIADGGFSGSSESFSKTMGVAATGGYSGNGFSSVSTFQGAMHQSGASGTLKFTEHDTRKLDGITVELEMDTFSVGEQFSSTKTRDRGYGTKGVGGGFAVSGGYGHVEGGFDAEGWNNW